MKGFSIRCRTALTDSAASVNPAALKLLRITSCLRNKYWYRSTIHLAFIAFSSVSARDASAGCISFSSCCETCSENYALHLLEIKELAGLLAIMSSGLNLLVRLCRTITEWQKCFLHRLRIAPLSWPLKVSRIMKGICSFG